MPAKAPHAETARCFKLCQPQRRRIPKFSNSSSSHAPQEPSSGIHNIIHQPHLARPPPPSLQMPSMGARGEAQQPFRDRDNGIPSRRVGCLFTFQGKCIMGLGTEKSSMAEAPTTTLNARASREIIRGSFELPLTLRHLLVKRNGSSAAARTPAK